MTYHHREVSLSFSSTISRAMHECVHEPTPSTRCRSVREMWNGPEYIQHRFPFAGAISLREVMHRMLMDNLSQTNSMFERLANTQLYGDVE